MTYAVFYVTTYVQFGLCTNAVGCHKPFQFKLQKRNSSVFSTLIHSHPVFVVF